MSFEGYYQYWCKNGHYWECDVYFSDDFCPHCKEKYVVENLVDETNSETVGRINPKIDKPAVICSHCKQGVIEQPTYKIPKKKKRKSK